MVLSDDLLPAVLCNTAGPPGVESLKFRDGR